MSYDKFLKNNTAITREAKFTDGTVADVHFVKCAHIDFERWRQAEKSEDPAQLERGKQLFIAACLVNPDGSRAITDEDSIKLTAEGVSILFPLALETSGITKRADPGNVGGEEVPSTSSASSP